jgi:hypothetical protein
MEGIKMESFEICFNDLTEEAQQRFLAFQDECEDVWNGFPIAIVDRDIVDDNN